VVNAGSAPLAVAPRRRFRNYDVSRATATDIVVARYLLTLASREAGTYGGLVPSPGCFTPQSRNTGSLCFTAKPPRLFRSYPHRITVSLLEPSPTVRARPTRVSDECYSASIMLPSLSIVSLVTATAGA